MLLISVVLIILTFVGIAATSSLIKAMLLVALCVTAVFFAVAPAIGPFACMCVAGVLVTIVGFGLVAPWIICLRAPYDNNVCPLDTETRKDLQRARLKWIVTLSLVALAFVLKVVFIKKTRNHFAAWKALLFV